MSARRMVMAAALISLAAPLTLTAHEDPTKVVAALDTEYQAAVERNDWRTMDRILHPEFAVVLGNGVLESRAFVIDAAKNADRVYEKQVEMPGTQTVRGYGKDTVIVTALLWLKGTRKSDNSAFEYKLWFTDTYVRTSAGWRYAFGQASLPLPKT